MEINELARVINAHSIANGKAKLEARNLSNQISVDGRFAPLGKSGFWALKSERGSVNRTIVELMEEFLHERNAGANVSEIHAAVASRRPVELSSIKVYLREPGGKFAQVRRGLGARLLGGSKKCPDVPVVELNAMTGCSSSGRTRTRSPWSRPRWCRRSHATQPPADTLTYMSGRCDAGRGRPRRPGG
jgi:hypothetical protein